MNIQKNIYLFNSFRSSYYQFDKDTSWLVGELIRINSSAFYQISQNFNTKEQMIQKIKDWSENVLQALHQGNVFKEMDRICLVSIENNSRVLSVISSANSERVTQNLIQVGYSCFVSQQSSLFKTKNGDVRIYNHVEDILSEYQNQGKPYQRAISKISKMGLKSGMAFPLTAHQEIIGYLFVNSKIEGYFSQLSDEKIFILNLLQNMALSLVMNVYLYNYIQLNKFENVIQKIPMNFVLKEPVQLEDLVHKYQPMIHFHIKLHYVNWAQFQKPIIIPLAHFIQKISLIGYLAGLANDPAIYMEVNFEALMKLEKLSLEIKIKKDFVQNQQFLLSCFRHQASILFDEAYFWIQYTFPLDILEAEYVDKVDYSF